MAVHATTIAAMLLCMLALAGARELPAQQVQPPADLTGTPDRSAGEGGGSPPGAENRAAPAGQERRTGRPVPRWRDSGTWRDDYDPRHDGRRYHPDIAPEMLQLPRRNAAEVNRWGQADPRNPARAPGAAPTGRFATPQEWGDEGGWDRGIWAGRGGDWRRQREP